MDVVGWDEFVHHVSGLQLFTPRTPEDRPHCWGFGLIPEEDLPKAGRMRVFFPLFCCVQLTIVR